MVTIKLLFDIFLFVLLIVIVIFIISKYKHNYKFLILLHKTYAKDQNLKQLCTSFLHIIAHKIRAKNASLYIYDQTTNKLYLGAAYGVSFNKLERTLDLNKNIKLRNILHNKLIVQENTRKNKFINSENTTNQILTIPLYNCKNIIGILEFSCNNSLKKTKIGFLKEIASIISIYLYKAKQYEQKKTYITLLNKNVLTLKTNLNGDIININKKLCNILKYSKEELLGKNYRIFIYSANFKKTFLSIYNTIIKGISWQGEIKTFTKDGNIFWLDTTISANKDINGNIIGFNVTGIDITDKKRMEEDSITDALTLLYNRRHFNTVFKQQINIAKRLKKNLAFILADIDYFKQYNDNYGHLEGDIVLKTVAKELKKLFKRADDYVFRLGGEEFGMLFYIKNLKEGYTIAENVRTNIERLRIIHKKNADSPFVTISLGLLIIKHYDTNHIADIYKKADNALYKAKKSGRNQISISVY